MTKDFLSLFNITPVALVVFLTACSSVPERPAVETPLDWQTNIPAHISLTAQAEADTSTDENAALVAWWSQLDDPVLNALLEQALVNNPSLNSAGINYQIALLQAGIATTAYRPKGTIGAGVSETDNEQGSRTSFSWRGNVSWELDLWGTRRAEKARAKAASERNLDELHAAQVSLMAQVVQSYVALRTAQQHKLLAQQAIELRQQSYQVVGWQRQAGLSTELEEAQELTRLRQAQAALPGYEKAQYEAIQQLQNLLGGDIQSFSEPLRTTQALPQIRLQPLAVDAEMLRQRPDVQAKEQAIKEQSEALVLARHARYPSLALSGSISNSSSRAADLFDADTIVTSLAANLNYLLFDGGHLRTNIKIQKLRLEQSLEDYRSTLLTAQQEVSNALTGLESSQRQHASYLQAYEAAELSANLATMQHDSGLLDFSDLLDDQVVLLNSQISLLSNQASILNAWVQLYRSLGGGWQALTHQPRVLTTGNDSE